MTRQADLNIAAVTFARSAKEAAVCVAVVLLVLVGGCRTGTTSSAGQLGNPLATTQSARVDPNATIQSDPCATRMHDIAGALLMYYALNQHLPERLEELTALNDLDSPKLEFTCPLSNMPYVYMPAGLRADGKSKAIILYDAAASHAGASRWCILMPDNVVSPSRSLEVLQLPESIFRLYR